MTKHEITQPPANAQGPTASTVHTAVNAKRMEHTMKQAPLIEPQTAWFHVFKQMVENGDVAQMGPYATTVYLVIKAYTNWTTGKSWPSVELIIEKTGMSKRQVLRSLKTLEDNEYVAKEKLGRKNIYRLREKIVMMDSEGRPQAAATWDYLPTTISNAVAEIRNFVSTGQENGLKIIHIDNLTLNIQQNFEGSHGEQTNLDLGKHAEKVWEKLLSDPDNVVAKAFRAAKGMGNNDQKE